MRAILPWTHRLGSWRRHSGGGRSTGPRREAPAGTPSFITRPLANVVTLLVVLGAMLGATLGAADVVAHDIPRESVINAFVKIEPDQAQLVVRVPLLLLGTMSFPANAQRELDVAGAGAATQRSLDAISQELTIRDDGDLLTPSAAAGRLSLPSDDSFAAYDTAVTHITQPISPETTIYADQGFFDAHFTYATHSPAANFEIRTMLLPELGESLTLLVQYMPLDSPARVYELTTDSGWVALDPGWHQAAWAFVKIGFDHLLFGLDHLLFLLCLIIPFRDLRSLLPVVTSFTVAHSITLIAAAYGVVPSGNWFMPLVETFIAGSIVYMALENIVAPSTHRRWLITGAFGLVHGFGFASSMTGDFQFAGDHLLPSLLAFNVGIELGQIVVLVAAVPVLGLLFQHVVPARLGVVILSTFLAYTGWNWMLERIAGLSGVDWPIPDTTADERLAWLIGVLLVLGGVAWLASTWSRVSAVVSQVGRSRRMKHPAGAD